MRYLPVILWAADSIGHSLIQGVTKFLGESPWAGTPRLIFEPAADPIREFRDLVAQVHEAGRNRGIATKPHVVFVAAAWVDCGDETLGLLGQASGVLEVALPGDQVITLVVLLPPAAATDSEKRQTYRFFLGLESAIGTIPFLRTVFVHQVRQDLRGGPAPQGTDDNEVPELVARALFDTEGDSLVRRVGALAIGNLRKVSGRKCSYSTLGCFRLIHPAEECLQHLRARFHREMFHGAFMDETSITEEHREEIQKTLDALIQTLLDLARKRLLGREKVSAGAFAAVLESGQTQAALLAFNKEFDGAINQDLSQMKDLLANIDSETRTDLRRFIPTSPGYLAGVRLYLASLQGTRLTPPEAGDSVQLSGVQFFRWHLCVEPFVALVVAALEPQLRNLAQQTSVELPQRQGAELTYHWLARAASSVDKVFREMKPGIRSPARFFAASFRCVRNHLDTDAGDAQKARALVDDLAVEFANEANALLDLATKNRELRKQAEEELYTLRARYGWLRRALFPPESFRLEQARLKGQIHRCDDELAELRTAFDITHRQFVDLINIAVLPYVLRTRISQRLIDTVNQAADHFSAFVNGLAGPLDQEWKQADIPQVQTSIAATVLTHGKVQTLYGTTLAGRSMPELALEILCFRADKPLGPDGQEPSYRDCHGFSDHYFAGAHTLLDRMRDYSEEKFRPTRLLGALDILELHAKGDGHAALQETVERTKSFLQLAPGTLARVESAHAAQSHFLVRTGGGVESRLAREYGHVFQPHVQFFDSRDPNVIDITCLIFGIPAFLIHALHECRKLALKNAQPTEDLWPIS